MKTGSRHFSWDKAYFGVSGYFAIFVLGMITLFLFFEASGFLPGYREDLQRYRNSGMEICDRMESVLDASLREVREDTQASGDSIRYQRLLVQAQKIRSGIEEARDLAREYRRQLISGARLPDVHILTSPGLFSSQLLELLPHWPFFGLEFDDPPSDALVQSLAAMSELQESDLFSIPVGLPGDRIGNIDTILAFLFGERWVTNSFRQDWFGVGPLFVGSILVSSIAMMLAIPLGIISAIYVSQLARPWERRYLKPGIELLASLPTIFLAFVGLLIVGPILVSLTNLPVLTWLPWFPLENGLNALVAGTMLGILAVPIIFTLSEEALLSVPAEFKEGAMAMGATRSQVLLGISLPIAAPGILSGVLLGFGRVVGETMIVLILAGNRLLIPEMSLASLPVLEPVHTMTGLIAQEMGEVGKSTLHYRALFMIAVILFLVTLHLNWFARYLMLKFQSSHRGMMNE